MARKVVGGGRLIATQHGRSEILFTCLLPFDHAEARGIVDDVAGAHGQAGDDADISIQTSEAAINESEFAVEFLKDGDIGILTDRKSAEFGAMDLVRGILSGTLDEIVEGNAHGAEFGDDFVKTEDREIASVQVG